MAEWFKACVSKRELAYVRHSIPPPVDVELQVPNFPEHGILRGGISVHTFAHYGANMWHLNSNFNAEEEETATFTAARFREGKDWHAQLLYKCKESAWDDLTWEVIPSSAVLICPRADAPEDARRMAPTSHSNYLLEHLDVWEFVGVLFRANTTAQLLEWSNGKIPAVAFAAEALLDTMKRIPALVDTLEPIALALLAVDAKTVPTLVEALTPSQWQILLHTCHSYNDYFSTRCAYDEETHDAELLELVNAPSLT